MIRVGVMDETWCDPPNCTSCNVVVCLSCHVIDTCHRPTRENINRAFSLFLFYAIDQHDARTQIRSQCEVKLINPWPWILVQNLFFIEEQNEVLPLQDEASLTIAVVGSACDAENDISALTSRWDLGNQYVVGGSGRVIPPTVVTILNGITKRVQHATIITSISDNVNDAITVSNNADVVLTCGSATTSESRDRDNLKLQEEDFLVPLSSGVNSKPIVVILMIPGAVTAVPQHHIA